MDTELWSPAIDLTAAAAPIELSFMSNFQDMAGSGDAWLDVSTNGGGTWTNLYYQNTDDPSMTVGVLREFDLSAYAGQTIHLRWHYDDENDWAWWWQIDDVLVAAMDCPTVVYDSGDNEISWSGTLPLGTAFTPAENEGFEDAAWPPQGWTLDNVTVGGIGGWYHITEADLAGSVHTGTYAAWANYTEPDIRLYSPYVDVTAGDSDLTFWARTNTDNPDATMTVYARVEGGASSEVWNMHDEAWGGSFDYRQATVDLSAYVGQRIRLEWWYESDPAGTSSSCGLDDIHLPGTGLDYSPSATVWLTVKVTDTVAGGTTITNIGTLEATHDPLICDQTESVSASAVSTVATGPDLSTSYKDAPDAVPGLGTIVYNVHVVNTGDELANITFTDPIPANTTYAWHTTPPPANFEYNAVSDQMEWTGHVAPGSEIVFTYAVDVDPVPLGTVITNTATVNWGTGTMDLTDSTYVVGQYQIYLPLTMK
jgi:uncharacterized repeat protein (TIGR01451 family)